MTVGRAIFYVYQYRRNDTGEVCYVGKGKGSRGKEHLKKSHNPHLEHIIKKHGATYERLGDGLLEEQAFALERELIAKFGRKEQGGPLVNLTEGGEGPSGATWKLTLETKAKMSASHTGTKATPEAIAKIRAVMNTPEVRAKMRAVRVGRKHTPEAIANMRAVRGTPEAKARASAARTGKRHTEETRQRMSGPRGKYRPHHKTLTENEGTVTPKK